MHRLIIESEDRAALDYIEKGIYQLLWKFGAKVTIQKETITVNLDNCTCKEYPIYCCEIHCKCEHKSVKQAGSFGIDYTATCNDCGHILSDT